MQVVEWRKLNRSWSIKFYFMLNLYNESSEKKTSKTVGGKKFIDEEMRPSQWAK